MRRACAGWALCLLLLPLTARADEPPMPHCTAYDGTEGRCATAAAWRLCDADQAQLPHVLAELRATEQALTVAAGDAQALSRALDAQSRLVVNLRAEVRSARPWLPGWAYTLGGFCLGIGASVLLALLLS